MVTPGLLDTNILIDYFNGITEAATEIGYYDDLAISSITWMELMSKFYALTQQGALLKADLEQIEEFLNSFSIIHEDAKIMIEATKVRALSIVTPPKIALPDAIIRATGNVTGRLIITRNTKDFRGAGVRHPYALTPTSPGTPGARYCITDVAPPLTGSTK